MAINQVHDKFFKSALSNKKVSEEFFASLLPADVLEQVELDNLELNDRSFIDQDMQATSCDMLFSTRFSGKPGYIYVLLEHQSTIAADMPLRLWRYILDIMQQHLKMHPNELLPIIYPLVFYTGLDKTWDKPIDLIEMFELDNQALAKQILHRPFQLIDINKLDEASILHYQRLALLVTVMKYRRDFNEMLPVLAELLTKLASVGETSYIHTMMVYAVEQGGAASPEAFKQKLDEALPEELRKTMGNIAQHFIDQGLQEGMQQGMQQGMQEMAQSIAKNLLKQGISKAVIAESSGLTPAQIEALARQIASDGTGL